MERDAPPTAEEEATMRLYRTADAASDSFHGSMEDITELMIELRKALRHYQATVPARPAPRGKRVRNG
jgi:hypothetical protein